MESKFKTVTKHKRRDDLTKDDKVNLLTGMAIWAEFWRKNPHRFVEDYLQLHLFLFQKILLYFMMKCDYFVFIACRGLGKSFLTAVFCITRCILYPGTKIIVVSGNKEQAGLIITEKIKELKEKSVMLNKEIKKIREGEDPACFFKNGSYIRVSTSGDGARGKRGNVLLVDEYRLVKEENLNSVLKQFLTAPRRPGFYDQPGYEDYPTERNKELYLSSAWYKIMPNLN